MVEPAVLGYLEQQNRPYSAIDIFNNLHKQHGKTAVVKALDALAQKGKIRSKIYGKQTVYVADQSAFPDVPEAELKGMDEKILHMTASLDATTAECKQLETALHKLNSSLTTEAAEMQHKHIKEELKTLEEKLKTLKSQTNAVSPEERKQIMSARDLYVRQWRKRKRITGDIVNAILEGYPKSKKELYEEVGLETDEQYNVKPPEL